MSGKIFLAGAGIIAAMFCLQTFYGCSDNKVKKSTGAEGVFDWQFPNPEAENAWKKYSFSEERWWGDFPKDLKAAPNTEKEFPWAIYPFRKYEGNPVLKPTPGSWDSGRMDGGVHNGSIIIKDDIFYYVYRGERPIDVTQDTKINYICDIGVATSTDGIHFVKDTVHSPFFRKGDDRRYSYEDVNIVKYSDTYYLFCNQWYWPDVNDFKINGTFLATSKDLVNWTKKGIVFPDAKRTHRNAVILQNPHNEAVSVNGKFVMYINNGLMAYSDDMLHWESVEVKQENRFPGGEGCFALAEYDPENPSDIILFTGGNHTGHFYAIGEVLFNKDDVEKPLTWLPRPALSADPGISYEHGFSADNPDEMISSFADCIFFNALTLHDGKWWVYYGGSEYYTCLATADLKGR